MDGSQVTLATMSADSTDMAIKDSELDSSLLLKKKHDATLHVATKSEDTALPMTGTENNAEQMLCPASISKNMTYMLTQK